MTLISTLARETGLSERDVLRIVASAPKRYKAYPIAKRNGGERIIAQPALEVKVLQRMLMMRVFSAYPIHDSAYAYVRGRSIRQNALRHARSEFILKLDFKNFFNSIRPVDLERVLNSRPVEGVSPADHETIYQLTFWGMRSPNPICLSIGAPSSPMISNIVMYEFDRAANEIATELQLTYTRYADDITVSSADSAQRLLAFEKRISSAIEKSPMRITLNQSKRGLYGRGERRMVTGLIITPDGRVSIGRERKREIRAALHRVSLGQADDRLMTHCKGMLAFIISAEPSYLRSLRKSVGTEVIKAVLKAPQISFYRDELSTALEL